ncbi:MAG: DUF72 domain-containing protein [Bdellovibrio sp.]
MGINIGISGWLYPPWRGIFYPPDLTHTKELHYASRHVQSIEINGSFYSLKKPTAYKHWYNETPDDFVFSVKGSRFITHIRRLGDVEIPLANFFASGILYLQQKLGPFLWQLPPRFLYNEERLENFFELLPRTFSQAYNLSEQADRFENSYPVSFKKIKQPLRHAIEVRHHSFENPFFIQLLRKHNIALVFADTAGKWPYMEDITSDFIYLRMHGDSELYASGYDDPTLRWWADRIKLWSSGKEPHDALTMLDSQLHKKKTANRDVYVYFDNDFKARAPINAQTLISFLKQREQRSPSHRHLVLQENFQPISFQNRI